MSQSPVLPSHTCVCTPGVKVKQDSIKGVFALFFRLILLLLGAVPRGSSRRFCPTFPPSVDVTQSDLAGHKGSVEPDLQGFLSSLRDRHTPLAPVATSKDGEHHKYTCFLQMASISDLIKSFFHCLI